jgi:hypothetical protein
MVAGVVVAALVLGGALQAHAEEPYPRHWTAATACPDVFVVGARGSGEERGPGGADAHRGFGSRAVAVLETLSEVLGARGLRVAPLSVDYPAIGVDEVARGLLDMRASGFGSSVDAGVAALQALVRSARQTCPDATHVLVGYSQGAEVVRRAVATGAIDEGSDIAAVILIADPAFDAAMAGVGVNLRGTYQSARHGVRRSIVGVTPAPWIAPRVFSVCNGGDIVCQFSMGRLPVSLLAWRGGRVVHESYGRSDLDPVVRADVWPLILERVRVDAMRRFVLVPL